MDETRKAAIGILMPRKLQVGDVEVEEGYVAVKVGTYSVYSCYFSPTGHLLNSYYSFTILRKVFRGEEVM